MEIPYELKKQCVELKKQGKTLREIYEETFKPVHPTMSRETFCRKMLYWSKRNFADSSTLESGTYEGFTAHNATVQVNGNGEITQAWIKQTADGYDYDELLEVIRENIKPIEVQLVANCNQLMLEIPLFDMHFGVADMKTYSDTLKRIIAILNADSYEEVNIIFGQDMLHNNDMRGHTAKGTQIEQIDIKTAWRDAFSFWATIIIASLKRSKKVRITYSKGNHDEFASWGLLKAIEQAFPQIEVDDSDHKRKIIHWQRCFVGLTHGEEPKSNIKDLRGAFISEYPLEYANSDVREIHTGHLHSEKEYGDSYGFVMRRLASGVPTDEWSSNQGYVGAAKRFQLFLFEPSRLKAVYYV